MIAPVASAADHAGGSGGDNAQKVQMIFWERQNWEPGGGSERLTLWADGRSEIAVKRREAPRKTRAGWIAETRESWAIYRRVEPYPKPEVKRMFAAALAAGIRELRTFSPGYNDGSGTLIGLEIGGELKQTVIPMFIHPDEKDNQGSTNHKTYLAVEKILGVFDVDAVEESVKKPGQ